MPRPRFRRRIGWIPEQRYFRPKGDGLSEPAEVLLALDEVETLRLADLEGLHQEEAAVDMGISRPTFGRILELAHSKVADALVNGKAIRITITSNEGFDVTAALSGPGGFCICPTCGFRKPHVTGMPCKKNVCPQCGSMMVRGTFDFEKKGGE